MTLPPLHYPRSSRQRLLLSAPDFHTHSSDWGKLANVQQWLVTGLGSVTPDGAAAAVEAAGGWVAGHVPSSSLLVLASPAAVDALLQTPAAKAGGISVVGAARGRGSARQPGLAPTPGVPGLHVHAHARPGGHACMHACSGQHGGLCDRLATG